MGILDTIDILLIPLAIVGGIIYAIYAWRGGGNPDANHDSGLGTLKRLYFYGIAFAALMTLVAGISLAAQSLLNTLFDGKALSLSSSQIAWGLSLIIVALPLWAFHWRFILRNVAAMPVEHRSVIRKLYIYLTLGVSLGFLMGVSYEIIKWAMRAGDFPEFSLASVLPWSMVWGYHWQIESAEGQPSVETRAIRRLYLYASSLVGVAMLAVGAGAIIHTLLQDAYTALFLETVTLMNWEGLAHESLRTDLVVAIVGGAVYWTHWGKFARDDRNSVLRWIFLFIASIGGAAAALAGVGVMAATTLSWLLAATSEPAALHFDDMPSAIAISGVGAIAWALFWRRALIEAVGDYAIPVRRTLRHLTAALGLVALAGAAFVIFNTALTILAESLGATMTDSDAWRSSVASILAMLIIGIPVWGYYWRRLRAEASANPEAEAAALSHRAYLFAVMGAGALAFLIGGVGTLFVMLRDLLDSELSVQTLRDLTPVAGGALTAALFLPYHWAIYRANQLLGPDDTPPPASRPIRKRVTILAAGGGSALAQTIEQAVGYPIREARWSDPEAFVPTLNEDQASRIADEISQAGGSYVLLIPDQAAGLRIVSYD